MIRRRPNPNTLDQMKKNWVQNGPVKSEEERIVRRFNQSGQSSKGRIKMDKDTYVVYDYGKEHPITRLETPKDKLADKNDPAVASNPDFKVSKFPILSMITNGPPPSDLKSTEMDLILNRSMNNAFLCKNGDFQYF